MGDMTERRLPFYGLNIRMQEVLVLTVSKGDGPVNFGRKGHELETSICKLLLWWSISSRMDLQSIYILFSLRPNTARQILTRRRA